MDIGAIIRTHRKERGLTQEQVAEKMGVSAPAVNKWENGNSYPDILLLGPLARLLGIDVNTLLCFREELTERELSGITEELSALFRTDGFEAGVLACEGYLKEYPSCHKLFLLTGQLMDSFLLFSPQVKDRDTHEKRAFSLVQEASGSEDRQTADTALSWMVTNYLRRHEFEKAEQLLDQLPDQTIDKNQLRCTLYVQKQDYKQAENAYSHLILQKLNSALTSLNLYSFLCLKLNRTEDAIQTAELYRETVQRFQLNLLFPYAPHLNIAMFQRDVTTTWAYMNQMIDFYLQNPAPDLSDTLLFSGVQTKASTQDHSAIVSMMIKSLKTDEEMDFLREAPGFEEHWKEIAGRLP